jgi:diguanylate cyclase (GGDEF)-like protein
MNSTTRSPMSYDELEERIRKEILPLFEAVTRGERAHFANRNKSACWEAIEAEPCRCPALLEADDVTEDISLANLVQELNSETVRPDHACSSCKVFDSACPTIVEELGEAFNTIVHILSNKDAAIGDAASLTRELAHSLESRDQENILIRERLHTDTLTGVSNRRHMNERLLEEVQRCHNRRRIISLLMIDIDDFKTYNDTYGHLEGDRVLATLGKLLRGSLRNYDQAFRYGGEEFVVLLPDADTQEALIVAERIRSGFSNLDFDASGPALGPKTPRRLTVSGGLVTYAKGMGVVELLERADGALYRAKRNGKNKIVLDEVLVGV